MRSVRTFTHVSNISMLILAQARQRQLERQRQKPRQRQKQIINTVCDVNSNGKLRRRRYGWSSGEGPRYSEPRVVRVKRPVRSRSRNLKSCKSLRGLSSPPVVKKKEEEEEEEVGISKAKNGAAGFGLRMGEMVQQMVTPPLSSNGSADYDGVGMTEFKVSGEDVIRSGSEGMGSGRETSPLPVSEGQNVKTEVKLESTVLDDVTSSMTLQHGNNNEKKKRKKEKKRKKKRSRDIDGNNDEDGSNETKKQRKLKKRKKENKKVKEEPGEQDNIITSQTIIEQQSEAIPRVKEEFEERAALELLRRESETGIDNNNTTIKTEHIDELPSLVKTESSSSSSSNDSDEYKWWEQERIEKKGWVTLKHNGVLFPPEYQPLPSHVKLYYDGFPVHLPPEAEEVAGFYAALLKSEHASNPVFQRNFFHDFLQVLKEAGGTLNKIQIRSFDKCDFTKMYEWFELKKQERLNRPAHEKRQLRLERAKLEEPYKYCEIDGRRERVGNFKVEPPDLFRGRGDHPKTGSLKRRIQPEDVILNLSPDAPIPEPPPGHHWREIRHDNTVQWLAMWKENIFGSFKYVRLAAGSAFKGISDYQKFEKARELKKYIGSIRENYRENLKSRLMVERQKAVALYLIDVFALRAGGEKSEDEADTVGCCSLRYEHVTLKPPNTVVLDFLGKDSIRYHQEVKVDRQVFKDLAIFKRPPKKPGHQLFDRLDPAMLNRYLSDFMPGLTAKVFRTYNASKTMQDQLDLIPNEGTVAEKLHKFNAANRTVAILCNHQKGVSKGFKRAVEKVDNKIKELKWQKIRLKKAILQLDPDEIKRRPNFFKDIDDISKEEELEIHKRLVENETIKLQKKFERENEKRSFENDELLKGYVLEGWLEQVDRMKEALENEHATGQIVLRPSQNTVEKIQKQIQKLEERIKASSIQLEDKKENAEVSLGTSKTNYIDPRLTVAFCKKYKVPFHKVFTKTLLEKFKWAIESADENWRF